MAARAEVIHRRVIPWEGGSWGVALRYSNRKRVAYPVGSRADAERELLNARDLPLHTVTDFRFSSTFVRGADR
jgi:hypothetical protein